MLSEFNNITDLIPQRPPFVMIDKLISSENGKTITSFLIKDDNRFVENGIFREPGLIENIAQTVGAGRGYTGLREHKSPQIGYIGSVKNLRIYFFPKVNTEITTEIQITNEVLNFTSVSGKVVAEGKIAAECELVVAIQGS